MLCTVSFLLSNYELQGDSFSPLECYAALNTFVQIALLLYFSAMSYLVTSNYSVENDPTAALGKLL